MINRSLSFLKASSHNSSQWNSISFFINRVNSSAISKNSGINILQKFANLIKLLTDLTFVRVAYSFIALTFLGLTQILHSTLIINLRYFTILTLNSLLLISSCSLASISRQRTLLTLLQWSYRLLEEKIKTLLIYTNIKSLRQSQSTLLINL